MLHIYKEIEYHIYHEVGKKISQANNKFYFPDIKNSKSLKNLICLTKPHRGMPACHVYGTFQLSLTHWGLVTTFAT